MTIQTFMLMINDVGSFLLVFVLWNLVHVNREINEPYAKTISGGYMLMGLIVIIVAILRHTDDQSWLIQYITPFSKIILAGTLLMVWRRLFEIRQSIISQPRSHTIHNLNSKD